MKKKLLAGTVGAAAALALYATVIEPRWIEVRRVRVHLQDLPPDLEGLRIGLLSDLHAGRTTPLSMVRRAARLVMRECPALVAVTGDLASEKLESFRPVLEALWELTPPLGVYAVPGNHDHRVGIEQWEREVREHSNFADLTNRSVVLPIGRARLCLVGVDDLSCGDPSLAALPDASRCDTTVLLAHNPDQAEEARRAFRNVDLVLSGHTHGGQVRLPGIGAVVNSVEHDELYEAGMEHRPWVQVYTSRGIGTVHLPVRFLSRPEVTVLELRGAAR